MPSRGAAALKAASSCPATADALRQPVEALGRAVGSQQARRQSAGSRWVAGHTFPVAPLGRFSCAIVILLSGLDRDGQASPVSGNGNFRLTAEASCGYVGELRWSPT